MTEIKRLPMDDRLLDRLVDGELSSEDYAEVLRALGEMPDGWRRCALAFLEAQAWQRELGLETRQLQPGPTPVAAKQPPAKARPWPLLLATAASFLLAFGLGIAMRPAPPVTSADSLAGQAGPVVGDRNRPGSPLEQETVPAGYVPSGNVTFVMDHGDGSGIREAPVPVYDWSPEHERWLSGQPTPPSSQLQRAVERFGHEVRTHKHFIPFETGDGRHVVFPVDQVEITPAGRRTYQ